MWMWKPIKGYEGLYEISDSGQVVSCERITSDGKRLKRKLINGGHFSNTYRFVCLRKGGVNRNCSIHRLVAEAFIPNPLNLPEVNHKDGNKLNNCVENLEWCNRSDNLKHAVEIGLVKSQCKITRSVIVIDSDGSEVEFPTMQDCCSFFGFTKCWLGNYTRKHGNPCRYGKYIICVSERGIV